MMNNPFNSKPKLKEVVTTEGLSYITYLYRDKKMIDEEVAKKIGISLRTLHRWKNESEKFKNAIKIGKQTVDVQVENKLLQKALEGDTTCMMFWLKNRKPDIWKDRRDVDVNANVDTQKFNDIINQVGGEGLSE